MILGRPAPPVHPEALAYSGRALLRFDVEHTPVASSAHFDLAERGLHEDARRRHAAAPWAEMDGPDGVSGPATLDALERAGT
jgi:hypothetical protein